MPPPPAAPDPPDQGGAGPGRGGYTLPVWLAAAARAATGVLLDETAGAAVDLELLEPPGRAAIAVEAAAPLLEGWALGQSRCDPGPGLDLTRGLAVWVLARLEPRPANDGANDGWLTIEAGEGVGLVAASGQACLSTYARRLLEANLRPLLPPGRALRLRVVLPAGRRLAERTSNAAFGVVEGLALIGTRAAVQAGASPDQLEATLAELERRCADPAFAGDLVLVIGENGLDLAPRLGLPADLLLKCGNWIGPVLVAAAEAGVRRLLLFGYQGKLLKLAGGIFHTHHHLADGRAAVLTAFAALEGLAGEGLAALHAAPTAEAALAGLEQADPELADRLRQRLAAAIETSAAAYLHRHGAPSLAPGAALFDRGRRLRVAGPIGTALLADFRSPGPPQAGGPEGDH
jgi:cobalt-precorrin-5B (C1)-methyltransferase